MYYTLFSSSFVKDDIKSIGKPKVSQDLVEKQFYGDYNSFYYKYISK